jgi:SAM-dependent methyltransferase
MANGGFVIFEDQSGDNSGIRAYYEENSLWFRWVGQRQQSQVIHRPVWAEGSQDRQIALNYVNERISRQVGMMMDCQRADRLDLLDLGCGFGATLQYLHRQWGEQIGAVGLTVSTKQAQVAQRWVEERGAAHDCAFLVADFQAAPLTGSFDLAFSIEAFAHASHPERYFAEVSRLLKPGARLILCDDFQADDRPSSMLNAADRRWLAIFKRGWHVPCLLSRTEVVALAQRYRLHLVEDTDLNPHLRTRSFPDACLPLFDWAVNHQGKLAPFLESVVGGWALEQAIGRRNVTYRFLVFEKEGNDEPLPNPPR